MMPWLWWIARSRRLRRELHLTNKFHGKFLLRFQPLFIALCLIAGCSAKNTLAPDPRAYKGSDRSVSLSRALEACDLKVPQSAAALKFFVRHDRGGVLLLKFTTDRAGFSQLSKTMGLDKEDLGAFDHSPFDDEERRLGWKFEAGHSYEYATLTKDVPPNYPGYSMAVDTTKRNAFVAYIKCIYD